MTGYILRRLVLFLPVLFLVSVVIFCVVRLLPGDAALIRLMGAGEGQATGAQVRALREELGLNKPLPNQYLDWLVNIARLDLGRSFYSNRPVTQEIAERFPRTLELGMLAMTVATLIAIPLGCLSAIHRGRVVDQAIRVLTVGGIAAPTFWVGTLLILLLAATFNWIPPIGYFNLWENPGTNLQQMALPALAIGYHASAILTRMTRSSMLDVLRQDYMRTGTAKGNRPWALIFRHALPNAVLPVLTVASVQFTVLLGGSVVIETLFVLPGLGSLLVSSILRRDYFVTQGVLITFALVVLIVNLIVDVLYAWIDPRIRYS